MSPATDEDEAWWPPTLVPSGFGRVLLAWWTMSALSQRTRFWIDSSVAMGASAMSSYLTAGRRDGPAAVPLLLRGRRRFRLGDEGTRRSGSATPAACRTDVRRLGKRRLRTPADPGHGD